MCIRIDLVDFLADIRVVCPSQFVPGHWRLGGRLVRGRHTRPVPSPLCSSANPFRAVSPALVPSDFRFFSAFPFGSFAIRFQTRYVLHGVAGGLSPLSRSANVSGNGVRGVSRFRFCGSPRPSIKPLTDIYGYVS